MSHLTFPADLPVPSDDSACTHLPGTRLPSTALPPTSAPSKLVDLLTLPGSLVLFCYPRTGEPGVNTPASWDAIPGARGCTPQACSFRDLYSDLQAAGAAHVFGVSTQDPAYQAEVHARLHLPFDLLSDEKLAFTKALHLPTFEWEGHTLIKRLALIVRDGVIEKVFYPVFPPDRSGPEVLEYLQARKIK